MKTDNELIAEFMGLPLTKSAPKFTGGFKEVPFQKWRYDTSWDWLMPVVEKITNIYCAPDTDWTLDDDKAYETIIRIPISTASIDIEFVYNKVVEFLKWYNNQKPEPING